MSTASPPAHYRISAVSGSVDGTQNEPLYNSGQNDDQDLWMMQTHDGSDNQLTDSMTFGINPISTSDYQPGQTLQSLQNQASSSSSNLANGVNSGSSSQDSMNAGDIIPSRAILDPDGSISSSAITDFNSQTNPNMPSSILPWIIPNPIQSLFARQTGENQFRARSASSNFLFMPNDPNNQGQVDFTRYLGRAMQTALTESPMFRNLLDAATDAGTQTIVVNTGDLTASHEGGNYVVNRGDQQDHDMDGENNRNQPGFITISPSNQITLNLDRWNPDFSDVGSFTAGIIGAVARAAHVDDFRNLVQNLNAGNFNALANEVSRHEEPTTVGQIAANIHNAILDRAVADGETALNEIRQSGAYLPPDNTPFGEHDQEEGDHDLGAVAEVVHDMQTSTAEDYDNEYRMNGILWHNPNVQSDSDSDDVMNAQNGLSRLLPLLLLGEGASNPLPFNPLDHPELR